MYLRARGVLSPTVLFVVFVCFGFFCFVLGWFVVVVVVVFVVVFCLFGFFFFLLLFLFVV